eukprot:TRINITY_DN39939_c0_g1_i1.p1 TRINITY_DN39939_c0_g1~~TRINITY_DN39939_c0_g1_i1.p1  ORF type:complete len:626 (+),score=224.17 TRINITY_DN39939_c0_g1_i1:77-1954(+)
MGAMGALTSNREALRNVVLLCGCISVLRLLSKVGAAAVQCVKTAAARRRVLAKIAPRVVHLMDRVKETRRVLEGLDQEKPISDAARKRILSTSACELSDAMKAGKQSVVEVVRVFAERALAAHLSTQCLTELLVTDSAPFPGAEKVYVGALDIAAKMDALQLSDRKGRLFGVPVSLKDCVGVAGCDTSLGDPADAGAWTEANSVVVRLLRREGAIIIAKSAVPQTMLSYECESPLFGRTVHPLSDDHSPGGSSGGEAALLSFSGSCIGIGTDIGGSIRMPCHFCGLYGLKPSAGRVPGIGVRSGVPGQEAVPGSCGPMSRRMEDCVQASRVLLSDGYTRDATCVPLPWDEAVYERTRTSKLRFGYYLHDGFLAAAPACRRAVEEAVAALRAAGHTCDEWAPPDMKLLVPLYARLLTSDGSRTINRAVVQAPAVSSLVMKTQVPAALKKVAGWLLRNVLRSPVLADITEGMNETTVAEYYAGQQLRQEWRNRVLERFAADGLDAVIAPPMPIPAPPHRTFLAAPFGACYTGPWNLLDWAGVSVPVTTVDPGSDADCSGLRVVDEMSHSKFYAGASAPYNAERMKGFPVGVQVLCPRLREEKALGAAAALDAALPQGRMRGLKQPLS